jgi:hypothetical protein
MNAQPGNLKNHHNVSMKRSVIILSVFSFLILVGSVTGIVHALAFCFMCEWHDFMRPIRLQKSRCPFRA